MIKSVIYEPEVAVKLDDIEIYEKSYIGLCEVEWLKHLFGNYIHLFRQRDKSKASIYDKVESMRKSTLYVNLSKILIMRIWKN